MLGDLEQKIKEQRLAIEELGRRIELLEKEKSKSALTTESEKSFRDMPFDPLRKIDQLTLRNINGITKIRARVTDNQTISDITDTKIQFDTETYDALEEFSGHKFTATKTGYYLISAMLLLDRAVDQKLFKLMIYKNGAKNSVAYTRTSGTNAQGVSITDIVFLNPGDYIEIYLFQNTGANVYTESLSGVNGETSYLIIHQIS